MCQPAHRGRRFANWPDSIDAIFSPVKQVAYKVENARVDQITDYDKLLLTIETDELII